jgi:hypothetical protein
MAFQINSSHILMMFHSDVQHSCKLQCQFEAEEGSGPIYRSRGVNQNEGAMWLQKFGE